MNLSSPKSFLNLLREGCEFSKKTQLSYLIIQLLSTIKIWKCSQGLPALTTFPEFDKLKRSYGDFTHRRLYSLFFSFNSHPTLYTLIAINDNLLCLTLYFLQILLFSRLFFLHFFFLYAYFLFVQCLLYESLRTDK